MVILRIAKDEFVYFKSISQLSNLINTIMQYFVLRV